MFTYSATVLANLDGDTIHARLDLGFTVHMDMKLRFAGINAPELGTGPGAQSAAFVAQTIPPGTVLTVRTNRDRTDKYGGRYDAWLLLADGSCLNRTLVANGLAAPYGSLPVDPPKGS